VLVVNAGHPKGSDRLERMLAARLRHDLAHVARDPITPINTLLVASDGPPRSAAFGREFARRSPASAGARAGC
jgi:hypothetical protein